jgi:hypothetical protein
MRACIVLHNNHRKCITTGHGELCSVLMHFIAGHATLLGELTPNTPPKKILGIKTWQDTKCNGSHGPMSPQVTDNVTQPCHTPVKTCEELVTNGHKK